MTSHCRRPTRTWPFIMVTRATLPRWARTLPDNAIKPWLNLFDVLTAERHDYSAVPLMDARWRIWLDCRDLAHARRILGALHDVGTVVVTDEHVTAIPDVDDVWRDRDEASERNRQNRAGGNPQTGGGGAESRPRFPQSDSWPQKTSEKQRPSATAVERPSHHKHDRLEKPPISPRLGDALAAAAGVATPGHMNGLGSMNDGVTPTPLPPPPERPDTHPPASAALRSSELVNQKPFVRG